MLLAFFSLCLILEQKIIERDAPFKLFFPNFIDWHIGNNNSSCKYILSIWLCFKPFNLPNVDNHIQIKNVHERGKVFMYKRKHLAFLTPTCSMNIFFYITGSATKMCVFYPLFMFRIQAKMNHCHALHTILWVDVVFLCLRKIHIYTWNEMYMLKKSFHYHPTYTVYRGDKNNGVICPYTCFKNDINLAYDWLKLS